MKIKPMFAYQGGKSKVAKKIVDVLMNNHGQDFTFVDTCCGGGSVSIEMVNEGLHPENIYMFDAGAIGAFWQQVSEGTIDIEYLEYLIDKIPKNPRDIQAHLKEMSEIKYEYVGEVVHEYLLLQAGAFGGKQIFDEGGRFSNTSFRAYWEPTETSSRRSPVNPMMPMPDTLLQRVKEIVEVMAPIKACHTFAENVNFNKIISESNKDVVVYIDPPYKGTTGYKDTVDLDLVISTAKDAGCAVYVSEYYALSDNCVVLSETRKGGISGDRAGTMVEYMSRV